MKTTNTLLSLFLICLCGCQPREAQESQIYRDYGLRAFEHIQTISGQAATPRGAISYETTYLKFENGKYVGSGGISSGPIDSSKLEHIEVELLWRKNEDGSAQAVLHELGSSGRSSDEIFTHEFKSTHSGVLSRFEDFQVVGYARSFLKNEHPKEKLDPTKVSSDLSYAIQECKYVVALGIKFIK